MPAVTEWVRHALFDLTRAAAELQQLQARLHQMVLASSESAGDARDVFERRRHVQLLREAAARMDTRVDETVNGIRALSRALPVSGTDALEATRCLQLARDARRSIKRAELDDERQRRVLVDAQLECFRRIRAANDVEREGLKQELEDLARTRRGQELRLIRRVERMAGLVGKKLAVALPVQVARR